MRSAFSVRTGLAQASQTSGATGPLPTLDAMVTAMKGASVTDRWDAVVSYSQDKLNQLLSRQFTAGKLVQAVNITTTGQDRHGTYPLVFAIQLGSPTLRFTAESGRCQLSMPIISGTYQEDSDAPKTIPANAYRLTAIVPIVSVSGAQGTVARSGDIITFSSGADADQHITLHFANEVETVYQIVSADGQSRTEDDFFQIYLAPKLAVWFKTNVTAFDYALATINTAVPTTGIVLKPQAFVFASSSSDHEGVLSLYIQMVGGSSVGNRSPSFKPGGTQMLPIPDGHTATIILSHNLFANLYLKSQLEKDPKYKVTVVETSEGIGLEAIVDQSVVKFMSESGTFSRLSVDKINLNLSSAPMRFTIKDGQLSVSWAYGQRIGWSSSNMFGGGGGYGEVDINIRLNKEPIALSGLTDQAITVDLAIENKDYNVSVEGVEPSFWERTFGRAQKTPPFSLAHLQLDMPEIKLNLGGLNFFASTNLLFPGQQVIDVDKTVGIRTPYDVLITGQIHNQPTRAALRLVGVASPQGKSATALLDELLTSQPVLSELMRGMASEVDGNVDTALKKAGYALQGEAGAAELESAIVALGDATDARAWGALYSISAPGWLVGQEIDVSSQTGRVKFRGTLMDLTIVASNHLQWTYDSKSYDITFDGSHGTDGIERLRFAGTVTTPAIPATATTSEIAQVVEVLSGSQYVLPEEDDWTSHPAAKGVMAVASLLGVTALGLASYLIKKCRGHQVAPEMRSMRRVVQRIDEGVELVAHREADPAELEWPEMARTVAQAIDTRVQTAIREGRAAVVQTPADIRAAISVEVTAAAREAMVLEARMALEPRMRTVLGRFAPLVDVGRVTGEAAARVIQPRFDELSVLRSGFTLIDVSINDAVFHRKEAHFAEQVQALQADVTRLEGEIRQTTGERDALQSARDAVDAALVDRAQLPDGGDALDIERARITRELEQREQTIRDRDAARIDAETRRSAADRDRADMDAQRNDARRDRAERGEAIFRH